MSLVTLPIAPRTVPTHKPAGLIFEDPVSRALLGHLKQVAPSDAGVLIIGETGTGKELIARHIHQHSARRDRAFIAVNCGAFAETLVEAELFGHERGAFTGAVNANAGWFEEADGGTLFLDEIGDLPLAVQAKLLRVLQEREVVRLGSRKLTPVNARILAATNVSLEEAVSAGRFREDLYYRLNVVTMRLSPLRDRPGDILPLARHFADFYGQRLGHGTTLFSEDARQKLMRHGWPGNIRELENVIHHALLTGSSPIDASHLRLSSLQGGRSSPATYRDEVSVDAQLDHAFRRLFEAEYTDLFDQVVSSLLRAAYRFCDGNQVKTSQLLGISRNVTRAQLIRIGELIVSKRRVLTEPEYPGSMP